MAEVIGLVASIITLGAASAELANTLLKVVNIIESAEYEMRLIATDILVFSHSLTQLSKVVELAHPETHKLREITEVLITACNILIEDLRALIGDPLPYHTARRALLMPYLRLRFRWMTNGPKVMFIKSLLDSFKTTILLLVSTMDLATALHHNAPEPIKECLKTQVQSNIAFAEDATDSLLRYKETTDKQSYSLEVTADSANSNEIDTLDSVHETSATSLGSSSQLTVLSADEAKQIALKYDDNIDVNDVGDSDEKSQLRLADGCNHIIEIQRASCGLARTVLESHISQTTAWSWNQSQASPAMEKSRSEKPPMEKKIHYSRSTYGRPYRSSPRGEDALDSEDYQERQWNDSDNDVLEDLPAEQQDKTKLNMLMGRISTLKLNEDEGLDPAPPLPESEKGPEDQKPDSGERRYTLPSSQDSTTVPPIPPPPPNSSAPASSSPHTPRGEEALIAKLEALLLGKAEADEKAAEKARKSQENAKFDRLEQILISQQEAKVEKEKMKKRAAEDAAEAAAIAKRQVEQDKLASLERIILAQRDDQLKRDAAIEAVRVAEKREAEAKAAELIAQKKEAAGNAKLMLDAAKAARKEAEKKAAVEYAEVGRAHEAALADARKSARSLLDAKLSDASVILEDTIGRKFSCPWKICNTWEGMKEFLRQSSGGIQAILDLLNSGEFDMLQNDVVIPSHLWETTVVPGLSVTMRARPGATSKKGSWFKKIVKSGSV
ncbi:hypothetical protein CC86DRAFT_471868 [Ophiobolus disseminans]|uniref:Ubiquitin-like domain-containing protein n=1 Tax=Ophiobolus disseminans TaxID=1469910 RepID=A0A6A6ZHR3_9PLEO|nr:hypothetical protein CC86DRAFT_471868 [Ophiobolus disseminans]